ncbi:MAG: hypothetical protein ACOZJX_05255 [Pseudomonadota bacterium]
MRKQLYEYEKKGLMTYWRDAARSGIMFAQAHGGRAAGFDICVEPAFGQWADLNAYDYLKAIPGAEAFAWDIGDRGIWLVADGTYWRPRDGRQPIVQRFGSLAAPLASLTGAASGVLALPKVPEFPAGLIAPNSRVVAQVDVARAGANGTATVAVRLGTAGTTADSSLYQASMAATDGLIAQIHQSARFGVSATSFYSLLNTNQNAQATNGADRSTNVNTAAKMTCNVTISSANTLDTFSVLGYSILLEG